MSGQADDPILKVLTDAQALIEVPASPDHPTGLWANMILPERFLGLQRFPCRLSARRWATFLDAQRGNIALDTAHGRVPFVDQIIVQVQLCA